MDQPADTAFVAYLAGMPLWKRALDISCLVIVLPLLLPLISVAAVIIKATSRGPLLSGEERIGFLEGRFTLLRFRTVVSNADSGPGAKSAPPEGKRLIPFGRLLRATGLDTLPKLINVLRGEMSLVGPRPCLPSEYDRHLPWQRQRFHALPGLTGLWRVPGGGRLTFDQMTDLDIQYVRTRSLWLDLKIVLRSVAAAVIEGVHGFQRVSDLIGRAWRRTTANLAVHCYAIGSLGRFGRFHAGGSNDKGRVWIGVDLDGTLAEYHGWVSIEHIGQPVPAMVERVKVWLGNGIEVRIFTARVCHPAGRGVATRAIGDWCEKHGLPRMPITNSKDLSMIELWDDRAVRVETNNGRCIDGPDVEARAQIGTTPRVPL